MKMIVGLGNPGKKYENNRHNVGFMFVDYIADQRRNEIQSQINAEMNWKYEKKLQALIFKTDSYIFVKPQTYMNNSGIAVKKLIENWSLKIENLLVIHDDLDIPLGKFKIQKGLGPRLHNGISSIEQHLKTKDFWRVRIGVDNRTKDILISGETYVLQDFQPEERKIVFNLFPQIYNQLMLPINRLG